MSTVKAQNSKQTKATKPTMSFDTFKSKLGQVRDTDGDLVAELLKVSAEQCAAGNRKYLLELVGNLKSIKFVGALIANYVLANSTGFKLNKDGVLVQSREKGVSITFKPSKAWPVNSWHRKPRKKSKSEKKAFDAKDKLQNAIAVMHKHGIPADHVAELLKELDVNKLYKELDTQASKKTTGTAKAKPSKTPK